MEPNLGHTTDTSSKPFPLVHRRKRLPTVDNYWPADRGPDIAGEDPDHPLSTLRLSSRPAGWPGRITGCGPRTDTRCGPPGGSPPGRSPGAVPDRMAQPVHRAGAKVSSPPKPRCGIAEPSLRPNAESPPEPRRESSDPNERANFAETLTVGLPAHNLPHSPRRAEVPPSPGPATARRTQPNADPSGWNARRPGRPACPRTPPGHRRGRHPGRGR